MIIRKQLDGDEKTDLGQQVTRYRRTCPYRYHYASQVHNRATENEEITVILRVQISRSIRTFMGVIYTEPPTGYLCLNLLNL